MGSNREEPGRLCSHELEESGCREPSKALQLRVTPLIKTSEDKVIPSNAFVYTCSSPWASRLQLPCKQRRVPGDTMSKEPVAKPRQKVNLLSPHPGR